MRMHCGEIQMSPDSQVQLFGERCSRRANEGHNHDYFLANRPSYTKRLSSIPSTALHILKCKYSTMVSIRITEEERVDFSIKAVYI